MTTPLQPIPQIPKGLQEAAQLGKLIPFIGAGASRLAGCPDWAQFANGALQWLVDKGKFTYSQLDQIRSLSPRVKLSLARILERENGILIDFDKLLHPKEREEKGVRLYSSLFKLAQTFVTTNYDKWLDERIQEPTASVSPDPTPKDTSSVSPMRVVHKVSDLLPARLSESNTVIHLHGSLRDPERMILATREYVDHYRNDGMATDPNSENRVLTFLEYLFSHKTVLFIGYGLEELEILEYVILKARRPHSTVGHEAKHYMLQGFFSHQEPLIRSLESYYLEECGIQLMPFLRDHKDWDQLLDVLEEFARLMPASAPLVLQKAQDMENLLNG